ncbi:MAG: hypothetical protein R2838_01185 [Caldilineaceae bacterium]
MGRNLNLGHGFVDFGGVGTVFLVAAGPAGGAGGLAPAGDRTPPRPSSRATAAAGGGGCAGHAGRRRGLALVQSAASERAHRCGAAGSLNVVLSAAAARSSRWSAHLVCRKGRSHPTLSARPGRGLIAGMALGPFVQPGTAFLTGILAGLTVPFVTYIVDTPEMDATGILSAAGLPAILGLLMVGLLADGWPVSAGRMTGLESHLGVTGQGVSGLFCCARIRRGFPGQFQAQLIGVVALSLWGLLTGLAVCVPLGLITHNLERSANRRASGVVKKRWSPPATWPCPWPKPNAPWTSITVRDARV